MTLRAKPLTSDATRPRGPAAPTLPAGGVRAVLDALERLGHDRASLLAAADLTPETLADPDSRVDCATWEALLMSVQRERPRTNLALHLAEVTPIGAHPLIDYLVLSSPTVGDGLRRLSKYYRLVGSTIPLVLREDGDPIHVVLDGPGAGFAVEYPVALMLLHLRRESGGRALAEFACFSHRPDDVAEMSQALGCPVRGGAPWSGFALSRATWSLAMPHRDPVLLSVLERHADDLVAGVSGSVRLAERVRRALAGGLAAGDAGLGTIARSLAMTSRTLQRRLADEGTTFQRLSDEARRAMAERHLRESVLSIAEISFVLGYAEPAVFHRAFRRWFGITPRTFRAGSGPDSRGAHLPPGPGRGRIN